MSAKTETVKPLPKEEIIADMPTLIDKVVAPQLQIIANFINENCSSPDENKKRMALTMKKNLIAMTGPANTQDESKQRVVVSYTDISAHLEMQEFEVANPQNRVAMDIDPESFSPNNSATYLMKHYSNGDQPIASRGYFFWGNEASNEMSVKVMADCILNRGESSQGVFTPDIPSANTFIHMLSVQA